MKFRILFLSFLAVMLMMVAGHKLTTAKASSVPVTVDGPTRQLILASTLQIAMYERAGVGAEIEVGSRGLATLVQQGNETLIITHDHWSHLSGNLHEVEWRNATDDLLLVQDRNSFLSLVVYRDGGTLVLKAPAGLDGLRPAPQANRDVVSGGEVVWLARLSPASGRTSVDVIPARVEAVEVDADPGRLRLRGLDENVIVPGDSGGGVWFNGALIGNLWASGVKVKRTFWNQWFGGGQELATRTIIAAAWPVTGIEAVVTSKEQASGLLP